MQLIIVLMIVAGTLAMEIPGSSNCNNFYHCQLMQNITVITSGKDAQSLIPGVRTTCPEDFIEHNRNCYYFSDEHLNWYGAVNYCKRRHSDLITIDNKEEDDYIHEYFNTHYHRTYHFWIGYNSLEDFHTWVWEETGEEAESYVNWGSVEPNNPKSEHCGLLWAYDSRLWADAPCYWPAGSEHDIGFVCKVRLHH